MTHTNTPTVFITGVSQGLGQALGEAFKGAGWNVIGTTRQPIEHSFLANPVGDLCDGTLLDVVRGDDTRVDVVVLNAAVLTVPDTGSEHLGPLLEADPARLTATVDVNVSSQLQLIQALLPRLAPRATVVAITSDAAVERYEGWGLYGASKSALEHVMGTLAAEESGERRWLCVDPGDMRTAMHQAAFPGEDISDRPLPAEAAESLVRLVTSDVTSGRYQLTAVSA